MSPDLPDNLGVEAGVKERDWSRCGHLVQLEQSVVVKHFASPKSKSQMVAGNFFQMCFLFESCFVVQDTECAEGDSGTVWAEQGISLALGLCSVDSHTRALKK